MKTSNAAWPADNVVMIEDTEIAEMAAGLARAYGLTDAATKATDYGIPPAWAAWTPRDRRPDIWG